MESRETITEQINATFRDNNQKFITAEKVRAFMDIINDSKFNLLDDSLSNLTFNLNNTNVSLQDVIDNLEEDIQDNTTRQNFTKQLALRFEYFRNSGTFDVDIPALNAFNDGVDLISSQILDSGQVTQRHERKYRLNRGIRTDSLPILIQSAGNVHENSYSGFFDSPNVTWTYDVNIDELTITFLIPATGSGTYRESVVWWFRAIDNWSDNAFVV